MRGQTDWGDVAARSLQKPEKARKKSPDPCAQSASLLKPQILGFGLRNRERINFSHVKSPVLWQFAKASCTANPGETERVMAPCTEEGKPEGRGGKGRGLAGQGQV